MKYKIGSIVHPYYRENLSDWVKWRLTYEGGRLFIDRYLEKFSTRENPDLFAKRRRITYNPAFAKQAVEEIKNAIFQRIVDVVRLGGSVSYHDAVDGLAGGVDLVGNSMASFIGTEILPELLTMSRIGIFVDMPEISGVSLVETQGKRPYIYAYKTEDIRSWCIDESSDEQEFTNILLRDTLEQYDDETGLPVGNVTRYRRVWIGLDDKVHVQFYDNDGLKVDRSGAKNIDSEIVLQIDRIPFVVAELSDSLLCDVSNYQIALLNLASSDMAYALQANYPFYTEQFDPRGDQSNFLKKVGTAQEPAKSTEVRVGIVTGRKYPKGVERPGFIHPSPEPLKASMEKQEQLKLEIRQLVNLSVSNLNSTKQISAETLKMDSQGLDAGLSYIGLELESVERKIAKYWAMYEKSDICMIQYPESYSLKTDAERRIEAKDYFELLNSIPSKTGQKEVIKHAVTLLLNRKIKQDDLRKIMAEIEQAPGSTADSTIINEDIIGGFLDLKTAAQLRGYPDGTAEKAAKDHAERLKRISEAQTPNNNMVNGGARGNPDLGNPADGSQEKQKAKDTTKDPIPQDKTRGKGK